MIRFILPANEHRPTSSRVIDASDEPNKSHRKDFLIQGYSTIYEAWATVGSHHNLRAAIETCFHRHEPDWTVGWYPMEPAPWKNDLD